MTKIPLTFCLFTSTAGHFGIDRWRATLEAFYRELPFDYYESNIAHIKVTPGQEDKADVMKCEIEGFGFQVIRTLGGWQHGTSTHSREYLKDCFTVYNDIDVRTPYAFHCEDDWHPVVSKGQYGDWVEKALRMLSRDSDLNQVRIARWHNEYERINRLKAKHGLPWRAVQTDDDHYFRHSDWSMNPFFARSREIRVAALINLKNPNAHVEHGIGDVMRAISNDPLPFACFNPAEIHICHTGTLEGECDSTTEPLIAT